MRHPTLDVKTTFLLEGPNCQPVPVAGWRVAGQLVPAGMEPAPPGVLRIRPPGFSDFQKIPRSQNHFPKLTFFHSFT